MPPKRIRRRPASTATSPAPEYKPSDLAIKDTVNKGKGVFTSVAIPKTTCIISEKPLVTFPIVHPKAQSSMMLAVVATCNEDDRQKIMAFGSSSVYVDLDPILGIAKTNCVPLVGSDQLGLFETICRINHDCRPNAQYFWDQTIGKEVLHALVDIHAGEEITVSYSTVIDRRQRRAALTSGLGFNCHCPSCSLPPAELAQSDRRMKKLSEIIDSTPMLLQLNPVSAITQIRQALVIIEQEKFWALASAQAYDAFQTCVAWSDLRNAKIWAGRGAEFHSRTCGVDGDGAVRMKALEQDPKSHRLWGAMGIRRLSS
ncbi:hypothetical protein FRB96_000751 [Tulasnella sp. 330]|nr:hypothetical protein FRB96_000751 [Tulasnella sp. 330]KAG8873568.1 hypothetical protein FRB97_006639 [Tulasnella sp. 331]